MKNYKLTIELVPSTSWFNNIRAMVSSSDWDTIKSMTFKKAGYRCEICGGKGHKWPVECHEVWEYDDVNNTQTLTRTIALCPTCHQVKHMGLQLTKFPSRVPRLINHMSKVNNSTRTEMEDYIEECFRVHSERSRCKWTVDVSWIKKRFPNMSFKEK
jgi:5-methylcytosine-specific restriction endonuclease McrA